MRACDMSGNDDHVAANGLSEELAEATINLSGNDDNVAANGVSEELAAEATQLNLSVEAFRRAYGPQLASSGVPEHFWAALHAKLVRIPAVSGRQVADIEKRIEGSSPNKDCVASRAFTQLLWHP